MHSQAAEQFNRIVEQYRRNMLFHARSYDWERFETKAAGLFDYLESIEVAEVDRRFVRIFTPMLMVLVLTVFSVLGIYADVRPEWMEFKNQFILAALAASCFDIYFFLNYRRYLHRKSTFYRQRRERFVRNIENDFRSFALQPEKNG